MVDPVQKDLKIYKERTKKNEKSQSLVSNSLNNG